MGLAAVIAPGNRAPFFSSSLSSTEELLHVQRDRCRLAYRTTRRCHRQCVALSRLAGTARTAAADQGGERACTHKQQRHTKHPHELAALARPKERQQQEAKRQRCAAAAEGTAAAVLRRCRGCIHGKKHRLGAFIGSERRGGE